MQGGFWIWLAALLLPLGAFAADLEFAGSLERIAPESILIRLADGARIDAKLRETGALTADSIASQYKLADIVQVTCKPVDASHCSELTRLNFLRAPTQKERALVLKTPPPASPSDPALEHARQVNLNRAANMPSFVADETAKRYVSRKSSPDAWKLVDTIESEITFKGGEPTRDHVRINGKPWNKPTIPNVSWSVEFGTEIKPVFDPECPTTIEFEGRQELRGKKLLAYRFSSPSYGCFGWATTGGKRYNAARTGRVLVEDPGGGMVQYEEVASDFPKGFGIQSYKEMTSWNDEKIGDSSYLLPVALDFFVGFANGDVWRVNVEYKNHRRFEADTSVTFHP